MTGLNLLFINFVPACLGIALPRTGTVCQPEASACMLWGSHMNNNHGYKPKYRQKLNRPCKALTKVLCAAMASKKYKKGHAPRERQNTMLVFNHDSIPFLVGLLLMAVLGIYVYVLYCAISHYRRV